jgi:menaquinone-dependent protoporphyrinogen oxidase
MTPKVLVVYASRHGATRGIAERVASALSKAGVDADLRPAAEARDVAAYGAFVVGSAVYAFHWLGEATAFVRQNRESLSTRPVWLFSSGPLGTEDTAPASTEPRPEPADLKWLREEIQPRDHRVFFGAYDSSSKPIGLVERVTRAMPAARDLLKDGDFRDWDEIDAWAQGIARELTATAVPSR